MLVFIISDIQSQIIINFGTANSIHTYLKAKILIKSYVTEHHYLYLMVYLTNAIEVIFNNFTVLLLKLLSREKCNKIDKNIGS